MNEDAQAKERRSRAEQSRAQQVRGGSGRREGRGRCAHTRQRALAVARDRSQAGSDADTWRVAEAAQGRMSGREGMCCVGHGMHRWQLRIGQGSERTAGGKKDRSKSRARGKQKRASGQKCGQRSLHAEKGWQRRDANGETMNLKEGPANLERSSQGVAVRCALAVDGYGPETYSTSLVALATLGVLSGCPGMPWDALGTPLRLDAQARRATWNTVDPARRPKNRWR
jgi:hypothetical protein